MRGNCPTNKRQGHGGNSVERDKKLSRPVESQNEFTTQFELDPIRSIATIFKTIT